MQQIFGADVDGARAAVIDGATPGYPRENLSQIPAGDYHVQAVLNIYGIFHCSDGVAVKLPMDQGEGRHWSEFGDCHLSRVCTGLNSQSA